VFGYRYLGDGDTDQHESLRDGRCHLDTVSVFVAIYLGVTKCETKKMERGSVFGPIKSHLTAAILVFQLM